MNKIALQFWSQVIQVAAAVVLLLSAVLMLTPALGETFFYLVYFQQPASLVAVPTATALMFGMPLLLARRHFGPPR